MTSTKPSLAAVANLYGYPIVYNLQMNGMMDKKGPPVDDTLEDIGLYKLRA